MDEPSESEIPEPTIAWSEARPGIGLVRLQGRTVVVMEQSVWESMRYGSSN